MITSAQIQATLRTALQPLHLQVIDQSAQHAGHSGNAGGGHFKVLIVSEEFASKSKLARHRDVYTALKTWMPQHIHALALETYSPQEWAIVRGKGN